MPERTRAASILGDVLGEECGDAARELHPEPGSEVHPDAMRVGWLVLV